MATSLPSKLTLDPADERWAEMLATWQDNEEYDLTLHVRQDSIGNFDILSASEAEPPVEEEVAPTEESAPAERPHPMADKYPRIAVMIGGVGKKK